MDELENAIEELVRPLVEADGGQIELISLEGDCATVRLSGACGGCPGAPYTQRGLIEPVLSKAAGRSIQVKLLRGPN